MVNGNNTEQNALELETLRKVELMAKEKLDEEKAREESLLHQASNMLTIFSISTAVLFMCLPTAIENRGVLSINTIFIFYIVITGCLVTSLIFATLAQWRYKMTVLPQNSDLYSKLQENISLFVTDIRRLFVNNIQNYESIQTSRFLINNKRVKNLQRSMISFYCAISFCIVFLVVVIITYVC